MQDDKQLKKNSVFGGLSTKDLRKIPEELPLKKKEKNCGSKAWRNSSKILKSFPISISVIIKKRKVDERRSLT